VFCQYTTFKIALLTYAAILLLGLQGIQFTTICISLFSDKHAAFKSKAKIGWISFRIMCRVERHVYPWTVISVGYRF
jgi:hypothetical protein